MVQTTPDSVTLRWRVVSDGNSPVVKTVINYKMTHGEWLSREVGWHQSEYTLGGLHCGREYNSYVVLVNALGASPTSEVLNVRTLGDRPSGPPDAEFVSANTSFVSLSLEKWDDHMCEILYFVIEYKLSTADTWTTVTNDLLPQPRYSIRGLMSDTVYDLKITAHNHAGSTSLRQAKYNSLSTKLYLGFIYEFLIAATLPKHFLRGTPTRLITATATRPTAT